MMSMPKQHQIHCRNSYLRLSSERRVHPQVFLYVHTLLKKDPRQQHYIRVLQNIYYRGHFHSPNQVSLLLEKATPQKVYITLKHLHLSLNLQISLRYDHNMQLFLLYLFDIYLPYIIPLQLRSLIDWFHVVLQNVHELDNRIARNIQALHSPYCV